MGNTVSSRPTFKPALQCMILECISVDHQWDMMGLEPASTEFTGLFMTLHLGDRTMVRIIVDGPIHVLLSVGHGEYGIMTDNFYPNFTMNCQQFHLRK